MEVFKISLYACRNVCEGKIIHTYFFFFPKDVYFNIEENLPYSLFRLEYCWPQFLLGIILWTPGDSFVDLVIGLGILWTYLDDSTALLPTREPTEITAYGKGLIGGRLTTPSPQNLHFFKPTKGRIPTEKRSCYTYIIVSKL